MEELSSHRKNDDIFFIVAQIPFHQKVHLAKNKQDSDNQEDREGKLGDNQDFSEHGAAASGSDGAFQHLNRLERGKDKCGIYSGPRRSGFVKFSVPVYSGIDGFVTDRLLLDFSQNIASRILQHLEKTVFVRISDGNAAVFDSDFITFD